MIFFIHVSPGQSNVLSLRPDRSISKEEWRGWVWSCSTKQSNKPWSGCCLCL